MSKSIFERNFARLKLGKFSPDMEHCKELIDLGYYTEAFIAMWILVEVISKDIQITNRAAIVAGRISDSLLNKLRKNNVDIEKNSLRDQLVDVAFVQAKNTQGAKREYIIAKDVVSGLKHIVTTVDEDMLMFLLSSKIDKAPAGFSSKTTIREKRNGLVHGKSRIEKDDLMNCMPYFDYFFSLTVMVNLSTVINPAQPA